MYDIYEILTKVFVSAAGALMWCLLVTFCCMCIEYLFFKKQIRPRLTDKEVILIKEVLAGHISLPLVANDGLFVECVDRIEHIFERFITRSRQQSEKLEKLSEKISTTQVENTPIDFNYPLLEEIQNTLEVKEKKQEQGKLLASSLDIFKLPTNCYNAFRYSMSCETVRDVLQVMLFFGSRKALLQLCYVGDTSVDNIEAIMLDNGLIYMQNYEYKSQYEDTKILGELRKNERFPRKRKK